MLNTVVDYDAAIKACLEDGTLDGSEDMNAVKETIREEVITGLQDWSRFITYSD